jgi:hypothetical protein
MIGLCHAEGLEIVFLMLLSISSTCKILGLLLQFKDSIKKPKIDDDDVVDVDVLTLVSLSKDGTMLSSKFDY